MPTIQHVPLLQEEEEGAKKSKKSKRSRFIDDIAAEDGGDEEEEDDDVRSRGLSPTPDTLKRCPSCFPHSQTNDVPGSTANAANSVQQPTVMRIHKVLPSQRMVVCREAPRVAQRRHTV